MWLPCLPALWRRSPSVANEPFPAEGRQPCRCLLADFWPDMHQSIAEYIALLDDDQKTPTALYKARLAKCLACEHLRDGTCTLCGCYVESRAAKRQLKCPDVPPRWGRVD